MNMQGYSYEITEKEEFAFARAEGVEVSFRDLTQVCGRVRGKKLAWALEFLQKASEGSIPVLYKKFNTNLGHRRELGGSKGRYPKKAALAVLKAVKSAAANARVKGLSEGLTIIHILANKKASYPRMQSKGRRFRANYETSRIEVIVKGPLAIEKKVEVKAPEAKAEAKGAGPVVGGKVQPWDSIGPTPHGKKAERGYEPKPEIKQETKTEVKKENEQIKKEVVKEAKKVDLSKLKRGEAKK